MAQRRMFSPDIVESDAFLDMPISTQALYFHLGMFADDDGFVNPKKIMRMIGVTDDDMKVLIGKRFVFPFENGVILIKHWRINNLVRKDWYKPTQYVEQKAKVFLKKNGAYTDDDKQGKKLLSSPKYLVNGSLTVRSRRLGKVRLGKDTIISELSSQIGELINIFKSINPTIDFGNKTIRKSAEELIRQFSFEKIKETAESAVSVQGKIYAPIITSPHQLKTKYAELSIYFKKQKGETKSNEMILHDGTKAIKKFGRWVSALNPDAEIDRKFFPEISKL